MADLRQALQWLLEGKKIMNRDWIAPIKGSARASYPTPYVYLEGNYLIDEENSSCSLHSLDYYDGWELYQEIPIGIWFEEKPRPTDLIGVNLYGLCPNGQILFIDMTRKVENIFLAFFFRPCVDHGFPPVPEYIWNKIEA